MALLLRHADLAHGRAHRAHCNDDGARTRVTFDTAYVDGDRTYSGTFHADPAYPGSTSDYHDIAVIVLDQPVQGIAPAKLPKAGSLSNLPKDQQFISVGYGAYEVTNGPGGHQYLYDDVRKYATGTLNSINKTLLRISMNPSTGNGGTCYGDSGGPNFLGSTNIDRRDHDHGRRGLPLHQRGLPARHRVGAGVPLAVCDAALTPSGAPGGGRTSPGVPIRWARCAS